VLASRTHCPLYFLGAETRGERLCLSLHGPAPTAPAEMDRRAATAAYMQWIADRFADFLRAHAPLWYFWADKHWTRVLAGDPRYGRVLTATEVADIAAETA
jgi:lauroyl/myristoyl acyltransferase